MSRFHIEFVFRSVSPSQRHQLVEFWEKHRSDWNACTRPQINRRQLHLEHRQSTRRTDTLNNVACIAWSKTNTIAAVAWLKVAQMPVDSKKAELVYFQRMYVAPEHRCASLSHHMIKHFHHNLVNSHSRSPLAKYLLAENANSKLKTPIGRRYFVRLGFIFVGFNQIGNEIWKKPLPPISSIPATPFSTPQIDHPSQSQTTNLGTTPSAQRFTLPSK